MAENSGIAWTTHTFNPWIGCMKTGPGCDGCYAEVWDARFGAGVAPHWGPGAPRRRTTVQNWNKVRRWELDAALNGVRPRVFCASLADVFDNEVPDGWRADLWALICECPSLDWILVTKRIGNVAKMAPLGGFPKNVIILATIVNQLEADRDCDKLKALVCAGIASSVGVSYEPSLGAVDWSRWLPKHGGPIRDAAGGTMDVMDPEPGISWLIVGGESTQGKHKARPFNVEWARDAIRQARGTGCAVFIKQMGSNCHDRISQLAFTDKAGADPSEWPEDLRVREFPIIGGNHG